MNYTLKVKRPHVLGWSTIDEEFTSESDARDYLINLCRTESIEESKIEPEDAELDKFFENLPEIDTEWREKEIKMKLAKDIFISWTKEGRLSAEAANRCFDNACDYAEQIFDRFNK